MTRRELMKKYKLSDTMLDVLLVFCNYTDPPLALKMLPNFNRTQEALASRGIIRYNTEDGWELTCGGRKLQKELRRAK